jgi:Tol biopolymer transport system component
MYFIASSFSGMVAYETNGPRLNRQALLTLPGERGEYRSAVRRLLASALVVMAAVAASLASAPAAVPGSNGRIVFSSDRDGNAEIYTMNPDGSRQRNRSTNPGSDFEPVLSPDATKIAFRSERDGSPEIYVMNATGTGQTRLTNNAVEDIQPEFSPDGTKLAFVRRSEFDFTNADIYVMGVDGTGPIQLTTDTGSDSEPAFSPDGTKIAWVTGRDGNGNEIYIMDADGQNQTRLTNNSASDLQPAFSPDNSKIVFSSDRDSGDREIYVMDVDGQNQTRLTNNSASDLQPAFSPDNSKIVFSSDRDSGDREIYVMDADDGGNPTRLTNSAGSDHQPVFSPDGTKIAFASARDGNAQIYTMDADGQNPVRVTNNSAGDNDPYWTKATAPPQNTVAPSIPAAAAPADVLTCDPGSWTGSPAFGFEWLRDGAPIAGATAQTYTVTADDVGHQIVCRVTATTPADVDAQASSNTVVPAVVTTPPPPPPPPPPSGKPAPTAQEQALSTASAATVAKAFGLPSAKRCQSRRRFPIHLRRPAGVSIATAKVAVNGKNVRTRKIAGRFTATIDLRGLPKGRFTVSIRVVTVSGKTLRGSRRYRTCRSRRLSGGNKGPL